MNLTVLGAGAWGTALAVHACATHPTRLWTRDPAQAAQMRSLRRNARYLPEVALPTALQITTDFAAAIAHAAGGLVLVATPMAALDEMLRRLPAQPPGVLWLCKGFQDGTGWLGHEVAQAACPGARVGALSGPSFALEVARGQPTALVAASADAALRQQAIDALHADGLRIYTSTDPVGVEVGGAVKNVLAIATGIADGLALGLNARAALITRGLAEMTRLGVALGARPATFAGLAGVGDLVLTCTGALSRNRALGVEIGRGATLEAALKGKETVAEGVTTAASALVLAEQHGVDMPIVQMVNRILFDGHTARSAVPELMARELRSEQDL